MNLVKRIILFVICYAILMLSFIPYLQVSEATIVKGNKEIARQILTDGMVLLKNDNEVLPLKNKDRIAIFGSAQVDFYVGGGGSSVMFTDKIVTPLEGMQKAVKDGKFKIYKPLIKQYESYVGEYKGLEAIYGKDAFGNVDTGKDYKTFEMPLSDSVVNEAANESNIAIYFLSRYSTEGDDISSGKGGYYLTDSEEEVLSKITEAFDKVVVVLNIPSVMDTSWFGGANPKYDIDSVIAGWYFGQEAGNGIADVLCGKVNPSGKLTATYASSYGDYLSSLNFEQGRDVYYEEDIFVGYRQFETFDPNYEKVNYEFGYGLSYTTFSIENVQTEVKMSSANDIKDATIEVKVKVRNTGKVHGREVIQVYFSSPQGVLGKPAKELAAFCKTSVIKAGKSETVTLSFPVSDMSSYDDTGKLIKSAYVLEEGDYKIYVGNSIKDASEVIYTLNIKELIVCEQLTERGYPTKLTKRLLADGNYETLEKRKLENNEQYITGYVNKREIPEELITLVDVYRDRDLMDSFLAQLTVEEMAKLAGGQTSHIVYAAGAMMGNVLSEYMVPNIEVTDGSQGVRVQSLATYFPSSYALACTWDLELAERFGNAVGMECASSGIDIWLGPGMNIIRNPLCGRNFEYYSEDPLVTGKFAAAVTKGVQSNNIGVSLKHFMANNKEKERGPSDSQVSERALREIYLKGFEICVKEADPVSIMSTCGIVNGTGAAGNYDLMTAIPRDEWGFSGFFMSDWANMDGEVDELLAGHNIGMPKNAPSVLVSAYESGKITREQLEQNTRCLLNNVMRLHSFKKIADPEYSKVTLDMLKKTDLKMADYLWMDGTAIIQSTKDKDGGNHLGNLYYGTYLVYRIEVQAEGKYSVMPRLASMYSEGAFEFIVDDKTEFTYKNKISTNDWNVWKNGHKNQVYLSKGTHEIKILITEDGLNLNYLRFEPVKVKLPFNVLLQKYAVLIISCIVVVVVIVLLVIRRKQRIAE